MIRALVLAVALIAATPPGFAALEPSEMLSDPEQEARAREISRELRCLVCQNQSIDDSNADVARDMRRAVRERITAGDSDADVLAFLRARYGDYVVLKPPVKPGTYLLWGAPVLLTLLGAMAVFAYFRRTRRTAEAPPLSVDEQARLSRLLEETRTDEPRA